MNNHQRSVTGIEPLHPVQGRQSIHGCTSTPKVQHSLYFKRLTKIG